MKKFFDYINGNKTLICATILYALTLGIVQDNIHPDILKFVEYLFMTLGGAALIHKGKKALTPESETPNT